MDGPRDHLLTHGTDGIGNSSWETWTEVLFNHYCKGSGVQWSSQFPNVTLTGKSCLVGSNSTIEDGDMTGSFRSSLTVL